MALSLLHFADTHIGIETYGRVDPATGRNTRLADFASALDRAVDIGLAAGVDAALFAGDAYRNCYPNPTHQDVFASAVRRLVEAGVPVLMVAGNHDLPVAFGRVNALAIFGTLLGERITVVTKPELVRLETRSGPLQVACLPWPTPSLLRADEDRTLDEAGLREALRVVCQQEIERLAGELQPALPALLLAHVTAAEATYSGGEMTATALGDPALSTGVLANPAFDYVALGHIHRYQDLNPGGRPSVVYPGSTERVDFGEAGDEKGVCLVAIGDGATPAERVTSYRHVAVGARPFVQVVAAIPAGRDATEYLTERLGGQDYSQTVFRLRYSCTDEQQEELDLEQVRRAIEPVHLLAGLIRDRPEPERRPRVEVTERHSLPEALTRWLETRAELAPLRDELMTAGLALDHELQGLEVGRDEEDAP